MKTNTKKLLNYAKTYGATRVTIGCRDEEIRSSLKHRSPHLIAFFNAFCPENPTKAILDGSAVDVGQATSKQLRIGIDIMKTIEPGTYQLTNRGAWRLIRTADEAAAIERIKTTSLKDKNAKQLKAVKAAVVSQKRKNSTQTQTA